MAVLVAVDFDECEQCTPSRSAPEANMVAGGQGLKIPRPVTVVGSRERAFFHDLLVSEVARSVGVARSHGRRNDG
jgi:hypothetical protein